VETEGPACKQTDAGIDRLNEGVGEAVLKGDEDRIDVVGDCVAESLEGLDA
jgi:hypothetical protein